MPICDRRPRHNPVVGPREDAAACNPALHGHFELPVESHGLAPLASTVRSSVESDLSHYQGPTTSGVLQFRQVALKRRSSLQEDIEGEEIRTFDMEILGSRV